MKILIAGTGPGNPELITLSAHKAALSADIIIVPRSKTSTQGLAEKVITHHFPDKKYLPLTFPMTRDSHTRDSLILSQLEAHRPDWENASTIFFPVIGDSMLYSTGKYLLDAFRLLVPDIEAEFIPGISAHSLAASCAKKFLAMDDEILAIIPGTADSERIRRTLSACDCAAVYKPTALTNPQELFIGFRAMRIDYAGIPGLERITYGDQALTNIHDYLSIILLWRDS